MTDLGEAFNRYGFVVEKTANKVQIRLAVEELYGVKVAASEYHALSWQTEAALHQIWCFNRENSFL